MSVPLALNLIDSHCHITSNMNTISQIPGIMTGRMMVMATSPSDWTSLEEAYRRYPKKIVPFFGIHPWSSNAQVDPALSRLEQLLKSNPDWHVGEIGIDKRFKNPLTGAPYPIDAQWSLFKKQMAIASAYQRAVSIHNVQMHGLFLDYLRELVQTSDRYSSRSIAFPSAIILHSYSGSVENARALLKLKHVGESIYFGFSHSVNSKASKTERVIQGIPADRILLETDCHGTDLVDGELQKVLEMVANAKGWSLEVCAAKTTCNVLRLLKKSQDSP